MKFLDIVSAPRGSARFLQRLRAEADINQPTVPAGTVENDPQRKSHSCGLLSLAHPSPWASQGYLLVARDGSQHYLSKTSVFFRANFWPMDITVHRRSRG